MSTSAKKMNELAAALLSQTVDDLPSLQEKLDEIVEQIARFELRKEDAIWAGDMEKANGIGYQIILRQIARKELRRRIKAKNKGEQR